MAAQIPLRVNKINAEEVTGNGSDLPVTWRERAPKRRGPNGSRLQIRELPIPYKKDYAGSSKNMMQATMNCAPLTGGKI